MNEIEDFEEGGGGEEEEELVLDPNNPDHAFIILEQEFNRIIGEIESNPETAPYADDYSKLFENLYKTHKKERELDKECSSLQEMLNEKTDKLDIAVKMGEADAMTISSLQGQIQDAWKLADRAHIREQAAQEIIDNLRKQITALNAEIDIRNKMGEEEEEMTQMSKNQEGLIRERDKLLGDVAQLTQKLNNALGYQEELERMASEADMKIDHINGLLEKEQNEMVRQKRAREKLEADILELEQDSDKKDELITQMQDTEVTSQKIMLKLENMNREQMLAYDKLLKEMDSVSGKCAKMQDDFDVMAFNYDVVKKEVVQKGNELKIKQEEANRYRAEANKATKVQEVYLKKIERAESEKNQVIIDREKLRQIIANMEKQIYLSKKQGDQDKRVMDGMAREKEILNKNILRQQAVAQDHIKLIKIQEQTKRKLEGEIDSYLNETGRLSKLINSLEIERDRIIEEELDLTKKVEDMMEDIATKKKDIYDLKKSVAEQDNKLRMQQNLFETVRAERNALQKSLQESGAECSELKAKLKISSHQTEQLKEDIAMKERMIIKEETVLKKVTKERENFKVEVSNCMDQVKALKGDIAEMLAEEKRLHKVILASDKKIREQAKDLEQLMNERDILGSQLVRRNDELSLLYEKIRILQSTLSRGEAQYEQRVEDIRLLKVEIKRLRQEKNLLAKSISNMTDLRREVFHLERDLTRERLRSRALEEEIQTPLNVHRWRKLEGSDPEVLELLQKVQVLQKRLIHKCSEAVERERHLKETEVLYLNLKQILSRQPSPEIQMELMKTQRALTLRRNKMKCLVSELNMTEKQSVDYKIDLQRLTAEFTKLKVKYFAEKKANRLAAMQTSEEQVAEKEVGKSRHSVKFTGGGFKLSL